MGKEELSNRDNWQKESKENSLNDELDFFELLEKTIKENNYEISIYRPSLSNKCLYENSEDYGFVVDTILENKKKNIKIFIEKKYGDKGGNAHERGYKYFTEKFQSYLKGITNNDEPIIIVYSGETFQQKKYLDEISSILYSNQYYIDKGNIEENKTYIKELISKIL